MNGIFDAHKGVYRVNNADGTFDTYTPEQYRELVAKENAVDTEEVVIVDQTILDENPQLVDMGLEVGDIGVGVSDVDTTADVDTETVTNEDNSQA